MGPKTHRALEQYPKPLPNRPTGPIGSIAPCIFPIGRVSALQPFVIWTGKTARYHCTPCGEPAGWQLYKGRRAYLIGRVRAHAVV